MTHLIDKDAVVAEIEKLMNRYDSEYDEDSTEVKAAKGNVCYEILCIIDSIEAQEVDLTDRKTYWCPSNKQIESLRDLLKYNIGVFDYQKFMEVNSLYEDLTKTLDYEIDRQK